MTKFGKLWTAAAMAAALAVSQGVAAETSSLAPGKPAGVQSAQRGGSPNLLLIGAAVVITVVAVVVATQSSNNAVCGAACTAPTTTS
jgi:hypothetical protein